jgi:hypothetical protein
MKYWRCSDFTSTTARAISPCEQDEPLVEREPLLLLNPE